MDTLDVREEEAIGTIVLVERVKDPLFDGQCVSLVLQSRGGVHQPLHFGTHLSPDRLPRIIRKWIEASGLELLVNIPNEVLHDGVVDGNVLRNSQRGHGEGSDFFRRLGRVGGFAEIRLDESDGGGTPSGHGHIEEPHSRGTLELSQDDGVGPDLPGLRFQLVKKVLVGRDPLIPRSLTNLDPGDGLVLHP